MSCAQYVSSLFPEFLEPWESASQKIKSLKVKVVEVKTFLRRFSSTSIKHVDVAETFQLIGRHHGWSVELGTGASAQRSNLYGRSNHGTIESDS